jgi:hypothetical protein
VARTLLGGAIICLVTLVITSLLSGCIGLPEERTRNATDAQDVAEEAACTPLPPCDIPQGATARQLQLALLGCLHEYRGLHAACYRVVHPLPPTAYGQAVCETVNPPRCFPETALVPWKP